MFIFDGGILTTEQHASITLRDGELAAYRFCDADEARRLLRPYVWRRVDKALAALKGGNAEYLHEGIGFA